MTEIVTEITIDASGAEEGASRYSAAMDEMEAAIDRVLNGNSRAAKEIEDDR